MTEKPHSLSRLVNDSTPHAPASHGELVQRLSLTRNADKSKTVNAGTGSKQGEGIGITQVIVPVSPVDKKKDAVQEVQYELRALPDGTPVLPVFTSSDMLHSAFGAEQHHVRIDIMELLKQIGGRAPLVVNPTSNRTARPVSEREESDGDEG